MRRDKLPGTARLGLEQLEPRLMMSATPGGMESDPFRDLLSHGGLCGCPICSGNGLAAIQVELGRTVANASSSRMAAGTPAGLPQLASRPGAAATLLLDFDGHFQSRWGSNADIYTPPYDTDGNYGSFSSEELDAIHEIWARVAEDYAPFNINVTTIDPGTNQRMARIAIGGNHSDWFGSPAGGVAYVGGFYNSAPNVAYVFEDALANGNPRYTAEAASHEAGHLFGLLHQATWSGGKLVEEYNSGNSQWAPTMGVGYYAERTTWHAGPTSNSATNIQDDLAILAGPNNAFGYVPDDYGNTISTASTLTIAHGGVRLSGLIGRNDDRDVFKFTTAGGPVSFTLDVAPFGPNLDGVLELWNAAGQTIVSANPPNSQGASLSTNLAAGTYYVVVRSSGGYGNLGTYTLSGTLVPGTLVSPDIAVSVAGSNLAAGDTLSFGTTPVGTAVSRTVTITNVGGGTLALSPLRPAALPAGFTLLSNIGRTSLAAGQSTSFTVRFDAAQAGTFGGPIAISSGDGDTPSFVVRLAGTAQAAVTQSGVRILDNGDAGFRTAGAWKRAAGAGHDQDLHWSPAGNGSATASWTFTGLEPGQYRIAATWPGSRLYADNASFSILSGSQLLGAVVVNQQRPASTFTDAGSAWQNMGTFTLPGNTLTVRLSDKANGRVIADAVRIERVYSTSGGTAFRVPLPSDDNALDDRMAALGSTSTPANRERLQAAALQAGNDPQRQATLEMHWAYALAGRPATALPAMPPAAEGGDADGGHGVALELLADLALRSLLDEA